MERIVLGITGSINTGKSSFCKALEGVGFYTISADHLVDDLYNKKSRGAQALLELNIDGIIKKDGSVDKVKLRELMFFDDKIREKVEKKIHPIIISEIQKIIEDKNNCKNLVAVEIPLLFEVKLQSLCSYTVTVSREHKSSVSSLINKYKVSEAEANKMINSQLPLTEKIMMSDFTIINNKELENLNKKAEILKRSILKLWKK